MSEPATGLRTLVTFRFQLESGECGRAFLPVHVGGKKGLSELESELAQSFATTFHDEEAEERLRLIRDALGRQNAIPVELYPTEFAPTRWEAFLRLDLTPGEPPEPLSGCMLFPMAAVHERLERPPFQFFESATVQVVEDAGSDVEVAAALEQWVRRLWPFLSTPTFQIERWPMFGTHRTVSRLHGGGPTHALPELKPRSLPSALEPAEIPAFLAPHESLERTA